MRACVRASGGPVESGRSSGSGEGEEVFAAREIPLFCAPRVVGEGGDERASERAEAFASLPESTRRPAAAVVA